MAGSHIANARPLSSLKTSKKSSFRISYTFNKNNWLVDRGKM
jgi:hypothetical protein